MHFLADHAIKSCHQSHSLPVPAVGRGGGLGKRGGWPSWAGGTVAAAQALCARVPAGRGARGAGQAPARVLSAAAAAAAAGRLLFLSQRLGHWHVAVLARTPGLKESEPRRPLPLAAGGARRGHHLPEPLSRGDMRPRLAALRPPGPPFV